MDLQSQSRSSTRNTPWRGEQAQAHVPRQSWVSTSRLGQGRAAALKGQGLGALKCHGPTPSHLLPHSATKSHHLSILMEQKGRSTSTQKSLTWNSTSLSCSSSIPWDLSCGNLRKSCFSTQALLWVKKPAVTASESYLGMELKSCQIVCGVKKTNSENQTQEAGDGKPQNVWRPQQTNSEIPKSPGLCQFTEPPLTPSPTFQKMSVHF